MRLTVYSGSDLAGWIYRDPNYHWFFDSNDPVPYIDGPFYSEETAQIKLLEHFRAHQAEMRRQSGNSPCCGEKIIDDEYCSCCYRLIARR